MLTPQQIHVILDLIDRQLILFVAKTSGSDVLSDSDKDVLIQNKIDYVPLYDETKDVVKLNFQLGMLSDILGERRAKQLTFTELKKYIESGNHIPLNQREIATVNSIKMQALSDIRSMKGKIFNDINNVVTKLTASARVNQEEYLRGKIVEGVENRQTRRQIAQEIARAVGDWSRNFDKSVAYISHTALNEGRAAIIERRYGSTDKAKIYFQVQPDACPSCIKSYIKDSVTGEPKVFTLSQLLANGNNIGRKQADWLPTLAALHIHCRCLATEYLEGTVWNGSRFVFPKERESKVERPKIKVQIDGVEHLV